MEVIVYIGAVLGVLAALNADLWLPPRFWRWLGPLNPGSY